MKQIISLIATVLATITLTNAELQIIGTGYGRTGTDTLRMALTTLGYKTYHMKEIILGSRRQDVIDWKTLIENDCKDKELLKDIFERGAWDAVLDFPGVMCWEQLIEIYPNAKVIHTERTYAEKWYESASNSILMIRKLFPFNVINRILPFWRDHRLMANAMWDKVCGKNVNESDADFPQNVKKDLMAAYDANNARVREVVPSERILIQDHGEGWTALANFLGKDIPNEPYPHSNTREEFLDFARRFSYGAAAVMSVVFLVVIALVKLLLRLRGSSKKKKKAE